MRCIPVSNKRHEVSSYSDPQLSSLVSGNAGDERHKVPRHYYSSSEDKFHKQLGKL